MKKWALIFCLSLTACISEQERAESMYRFEAIMRNQCEQTLGFKTGTKNYMECQMFYDEYLTANGYNVSYMSFSKAQAIQTLIKKQNEQCIRYWGNSNIQGENLWSCIHQQGEKKIEEAARQKELQEQEQMLTRSIAAGQKQANDDARLQDRIDAERERVAKEKGVNPKKVTCKTYRKSNNYIQVKCK